MSAWAKPGVKCVCVDASWHGLPTSPLVEGAKYTIRSVAMYDGDLVADFLEAQNPEDAKFPESPPGFRIDRFRPLVTKTQEQDVAMFRHLLTPSRSPVRELVE